MNDNIFAQYHRADSDHRLELFLQYRDLRASFEEIEREESQTDYHTREIIPQNKKSQSPVVRILRWCYTLFS